MSLFRHPHLVRGIVHTAEGAFVIHRGIVEPPRRLRRLPGLGSTG